MPEPAQSWCGLAMKGGVELVRPGRRLHRALQQQALESGSDGVRAMLQIDLELAGA